MLLKFESKSNRVKGLAFHPKRPWLLTSLHNGTVQIWDYRMGTLVDKYEEHEGPVRGCAFHPSQPLFVTGGDDGKVKVFNYQQRRCLFTLAGHTDYIRTVFFHEQSPWIVSASDDQTVRVWNWQSRSCLAVLTGHSHYVMCAQFHPTEDLLVSASLDQTIRVWDIGSLRRKHSSPASSPYEIASPRPSGIDLFGAPEGQVRFILEGHDRGVNWVQFHASKPLIVSASDDRSIKLWRYNDSRAWETDTFRGHMNNISSVMFHPHADLILSDSEDKTIRIWDYTRRGVSPIVYKRDAERFWILAGHPHLNLIAAGHDAGLMIFKLEHERPAYTVHDELVVVAREHHLLSIDGRGQETALAMISDKPGRPAVVSYSPADNAVLFSSTRPGSGYLLASLRAGGGENVHRGEGLFGVFVARNRFAILVGGLEGKASVVLKALDNTVYRTIVCPAGVNRLLPGPANTFLMASGERVYLYDVSGDKIVAETTLSHVKYAAWSGDMQRLALYGKHIIYVVDRSSLAVRSTIRETVNVKSCVWDSRVPGILYYTNSHHLKYVLPNGDSGVVRTLEEPLYLVRTRDNAITVMDRSASVRPLTIDATEIMFKLALLEGDQTRVMEMIENGNLIGQSIIAYLRSHGYAEIALGFVSDPATRFKLAVECCDLAIALECAERLESAAVWRELAEAAMVLGNFVMAEQCFQQLGDRDRLGFLYLITGDLGKLRTLTDEARATGDVHTRLKNALLLGDHVDMASCLAEEAGTPALAYLASRTAGLDVEAQDILEKRGPATKSAIESSLGCRLARLEPIMRQSDPWPLSADPVKAKVSTRTKSRQTGQDNRFETVVSNSGVPVESTVQIPPDFEDSAGWGIEETDVNEALAGGVSDEFVDIEEGTLPPVRADPLGAESLSSSGSASVSAFHHFALGDLKGGMRVLREQFGIANFEPLEPLIMRCLQGASVPMEEFRGTVRFLPNLVDREGSIAAIHPRPLLTVASLEEELETAMRLTTAGKFADASSIFESVLHGTLFTGGKDASTRSKELVDVCREYLVGLHIEQLRRERMNSEPEESLALACYFTYCKLRPEHLILALRSALTQAYKMQCLSLAGRLAKRLLELGSSEAVASQAQKIVALADKLPLNHQDPARVWEPAQVTALDSAYGLPIAAGESTIKCVFCRAPYAEGFAGNVCCICKVAMVRSDC